MIARALDKNPERRYQTCAELMTAARAVVESAGPLAETLPPRRAGGPDPALEEVGDARRARVLLAGVDASTRAIAHVALGGRVDVREAGTATALEVARDARPDLVILGAAEVVSALRADPLTRDSKLLLVLDESAGRDPRAAGAEERLSSPFSPLQLQLQVKLRKLLGADAIGA